MALLLLASLLHDPVTSKCLEIAFYQFSFVYNILGVPQLALFHQAMPLQGTGNHFWSVNAEEQFYLLAPLLLVLATPRFGRSAIIWGIIAVLAWLTHNYASIALGVIAAIIVKNYGAIHLRQTSRLIFTTVIIASTFSFYHGFYYELVAPICAISIVMLLALKGTQHSIGAFVGGMSYPLYLNHWIGVFIAHAALKPFGLRDSVIAHISSFILNLVIAATLYWFVDRRILAMRAKLYAVERGKLIIIIGYGVVAIGICVGTFLSLSHIN